MLDIVSGMKDCQKCGLSLPSSHFKKLSYGRFAGYCLTCHEISRKEAANISVRKYRKEYPERHRASLRNSRLKRLYGMTEAELLDRISRQGGACAICGAVLVRRKVAGIKVFACVDHNHITGDVRKILCSSCNGGLGLFGDNPDVLRKAIIYLEGRE